MTTDALAVLANAIAIVAIVVSMITAWSSRVGARRIAERQQTFEFRFYQLRMLDLAKGTLRRLFVDCRRGQDGVAIEGPSPQYSDELRRLSAQTLETFHTIGQYLPPDKRVALEELGRGLVFMPDQENLAGDWRSLTTYLGEFLQAVEVRLQQLLRSLGRE